MDRSIITVFGSSAPQEIEPAYQSAYRLGRVLAGAGWTVCNGGYGGTMEAAARGAVEAGGHTIGVTCSAFGRSGANPYIRQEVPTFDLLTRLNTLIRLGRGYVVLPGGTGTLLELSCVWEMTNKSIWKVRRPIVLLGRFWEPVLECVCRETSDVDMPHIVEHAEDVPQILTDALSKGKSAQ